MPTILIVEDDSELRELLTIILDAQGYAVLEAANGREAWALCTQETCIPDVIVLDIEMPVLDGWGFLEKRSLNERISKVPVIVASATDAEAKAQAYRGVHVLRKPFFASQILTMTRQVLNP